MLSIYLKTPQNYSNKVIIINSTPPLLKYQLLMLFQAGFSELATFIGREEEKFLASPSLYRFK